MNLATFCAIPALYISAIFTIGTFAARQSRAGCLSGLAACVLILGAGRAAMPSLAQYTTPGVSLLFANMFYGNQTPAKLLPFVAAERPDIIVVVESSPQERSILQANLSGRYRYQFFYGETHVMSRFPLVDKGYLPIGHTVQGFLVNTPQGPLDLEIVHFSRPWPYANTRDPRSNPPDQIKLFLNHLKGRDTASTVVVGDFNATPNSRLMRQLEKGANLRVLGAPVGTWPANFPGYLRLNFDNALFGKSLGVTRRRVGPNTGSDHRPILIDVHRQK